MILSEDTTSASVTNSTIDSSGTDAIQIGSADTYQIGTTVYTGTGNPASQVTISNNTLTASATRSPAFA